MGSKFNLEKQMTENGIKEDKDLSLLLKLAAETTAVHAPLYASTTTTATAIAVPEQKIVKPKYHSSSTFTNHFFSYPNHNSEANIIKLQPDISGKNEPKTTTTTASLHLPDYHVGKNRNNSIERNIEEKILSSSPSYYSTFPMLLPNIDQLDPTVSPCVTYSNAPQTPFNFKSKKKGQIKVCNKKHLNGLSLSSTKNNNINGSTKRAKKTQNLSRKRGGKRSQSATMSSVVNSQQPFSQVESETLATGTGTGIGTGSKSNKVTALSSSLSHTSAAILRGVTQRPSGKWQAQLYYAGKSRYIGVFDSREKAALAYEIAREKLKTNDKNKAVPSSSGQGGADDGTSLQQQTEANINAARKAAFEGVKQSFQLLK